MNSNTPPKLARKLLTWFSDAYWIDELLGDLEEEYNDNLKSKGKSQANIIYT
jgi:putative ABC transport system permease protein